MQLTFYFDQTRCNGCFACTVACKNWYDIQAGPVSWRRVSVIEKGTYPNLFVAFLSQSCYHCEKPACIAACPVNAISKHESDGIVIVDRDKCLGADKCGKTCLDACPYDVPQFGAEENAKMQKCGFCAQRWEEGKLPVCVAACPTRALDAGCSEEIESKYGALREAIGFDHNREVGPAIVFKPKPDIRPEVVIL